MSATFERYYVCGCYTYGAKIQYETLTNFLSRLIHEFYEISHLAPCSPILAAFAREKADELSATPFSCTLHSVVI